MGAEEGADTEPKLSFPSFSAVVRSLVILLEVEAVSLVIVGEGTVDDMAVERSTPEAFEALAVFSLAALGTVALVPAIVTTVVALTVVVVVVVLLTLLAVFPVFGASG